ncbi:MAG: hypothetical protein AB7V42_15730 [Thermoleophilia bacterium]
MTRRSQRGQAGLEVLALLPLVVLAALLAWQLAAVVSAGMRAEQDARADALRATGARGRIVVVERRVTVPQVLPGAGGLVIRARAGVRAP